MSLAVIERRRSTHRLGQPPVARKLEKLISRLTHSPSPSSSVHSRIFASAHVIPAVVLAERDHPDERSRRAEELPPARPMGLRGGIVGERVRSA
jgi:hypothetical protein